LNQYRREVLWIILALWAGFSALSLLFPGGGNRGAMGLSFYNFSELWKFASNKPEDAARTDSLIKYYTEKANLGEYNHSDSLLPFPEIDLARKGFLNAEIPSELLPFFRALDSVSGNNGIKIAHYGDSQIEGDRITAHLRKLFQANFGGRGIGYIPLADPASVWAYQRSGSANWKRHSVFQNKLSEGLYGVSGTAYRFARTEIRDSISPDSISVRVIEGNRANLKFNFTHVTSFEPVKLAYAMPQSPTQVVVKTSDTSRTKINLDGNKRWNELTLPMLGASSKLELEFEGEKSPILYGLYMEGKGGIQVDNYAIRGHAGEGLLQIPVDILAEQANQQNIKLFIFQYGNNAIPYLDSIGECKAFEEVYYRLFSRFRQTVPGASILVIGVGDMLTRVQGQDVTWPLLIEFRNAQKRAALRAGCAFWDLFEAMGGERSLLAWNEKKLAAKDGHLSPSGQQLIAAKIHEDIMAAYIRYRNNK
jgi:hypothetical protein